jgi:type I restriction enzyme R subunit
MKTDTSEKGLEALIVRAMTGRTDLLDPPHVTTEDAVPLADGTGWLLGDPKHFDREHAVDLVQLRGFPKATQPEVAEACGLDADARERQGRGALPAQRLQRHATASLQP